MAMQTNPVGLKTKDGKLCTKRLSAFSTLKKASTLLALKWSEEARDYAQSGYR